MKCRKMLSWTGSRLAPAFWRKFAEFAPEEADTTPFRYWGTPDLLDWDARGVRAPKPSRLSLWDDDLLLVPR